MPPTLCEWLPEGHLALFISDLAEPERRAAERGRKPQGRPPQVPDPDPAVPDPKAQRNFTDGDAGGERHPAG